MKEFKPRHVAAEADTASASAEMFEWLIGQLRNMPVSQGGVEALRLSSILLEYAAYELAAELGSDRAGALIDAAADVSNHAQSYVESVGDGSREKMSLLH